MVRILFLGLILVLFVSGCAAFDRARKAATTPDPVTGLTPAETVLKNLPRAIALDPTAIASIVGSLTTVILAAAGLVTGGNAAAKVYQVRAARKAGSAVVRVNTAAAGGAT